MIAQLAVVAPTCEAYRRLMSNDRPPDIKPSNEDAPQECERCGKPVELCVCDGIVPLENRIELLILQHPQEQDRALGTARLTAMHFTKATLKIGLSWPSLSKILGRTVDPARWAILYLGSSKVAALETDRDVVMLDRKGALEDNQTALLKSIEGVIVLDGTWSQAKALWWRNAWMLKCRRVILGPAQPSRYGKLRREPRRDGLSTLEAAAMLLSRLERREEIATALHASFDRLLTNYRAAQAAGSEVAPKPVARRSGRVRRRK